MSNCAIHRTTSLSTTMSYPRHVIYNAHGLSLGDFNDARWLALTKLARLIPYFVLYSLIALLYVAFRRWRRRTRRRRLDAEHQSADFLRLQQQLVSKERQAHTLKCIGNRYYASMVNARTSQCQTRAQLVQHQKDVHLSAHRHAFQLATMYAARIASDKASVAQLSTQFKSLDAQLLIARRLTFKAVAETVAQVAKRKGLSAKLLDQYRHRASQSAALADQSFRHDEDLLAARRVAFKAIAQAAATTAINKTLLAQLSSAQSQLRNTRTVQSMALQALGANSFAEAIHDKHVRDEELSKVQARTKALENQTAVLKLISGLTDGEHTEEITEKDQSLETLQQRFDQQANAYASYQAGAQEREAQLSCTFLSLAVRPSILIMLSAELASHNSELKTLEQRFDDQVTAHMAYQAGAQGREAQLNCACFDTAI